MRSRPAAFALMAIALMAGACRAHPVAGSGARGAARCTDPTGDVHVPKGIGPVTSADLRDATLQADGRTLIASFDTAGRMARALPEGTFEYWSVRLYSPSGGYVGELQVSLTAQGSSAVLGRASLPPLREPVRVTASRASTTASLDDIPGLLGGFRWVAASSWTSVNATRSGTMTDFCPVQDEGPIILKTVYFPGPPKHIEPRSPFTKGTP
ncbi:MAG: hypothetical protein ACXVEX_12310 [Actinomycetota bacterium]